MKKDYPFNVYLEDLQDEEKALSFLYSFNEQSILQENQYLEFKRANNLCKSKKEKDSLHPDDKKNIAKALCGFANSDGGILVFGIDDDKNIKKGQKRVNLVKNVSEYAGVVNKQAGQFVEPCGVKFNAFSVLENNNEGFVVIVVYPSENSIYRSCCDKQFYIRSGEGTYPLPLSTVFQIISGSKRLPQMNIVVKSSFKCNKYGEKYTAKIEFYLKNISKIHSFTDIFWDAKSQIKYFRDGAFELHPREIRNKCDKLRPNQTHLIFIYNTEEQEQSYFNGTSEKKDVILNFMGDVYADNFEGRSFKIEVKAGHFASYIEESHQPEGKDISVNLSKYLKSWEIVD